MASIVKAGYGFTDMNVLVQSNKKECRSTCQFLVDYGYECIALNHEVQLAKKVRLQAAPGMDSIVENASSFKTKHGRPIQLLQRLTVCVSDPSLLHTLASQSLNTYDLLAVCPQTEKAFKVACSSLDVDIISMKLDERSPFRLKSTQIGLAVERGVHFEICYSPAVRDSTARRYTLANAMELVEAAKGKKIIVSSRAEKALETRAPADIINLCQLFGVNSGKCKALVTSNCRAVRLHAAMRRKTVKGVVSCELIREPAAAVEGNDNKQKKEEEEVTGGCLKDSEKKDTPVALEENGSEEMTRDDAVAGKHGKAGRKRRRQSKNEPEQKKMKQTTEGSHQE